MLKVASFFAGVGGVDLGFEKAGFNTIYANEFDDYAADIVRKIFAWKIETLMIFQLTQYRILT